MGYDYSPEAVKNLAKKKLPCRQVDLNDIASTQLCLSMDIKKSPINFVAIRILQYIDKKALIALIFILMDNAPANSRFIIANSISDDNEPKTFNKNYIASFFGGRTDVRFLLMAQTAEKLKVGPPIIKHNEDEVLVVQKL